MNITLELAQTLINYLATKPYNEVYTLILQLQMAGPQPVKKEEPKAVSKSPEPKKDETAG